MQRYFFDIVSESGVSHDHQGREFPCADSARNSVSAARDTSAAFALR